MKESQATGTAQYLKKIRDRRENGKTYEERINLLEAGHKEIKRAMPRKVFGLMPPTLLSNYTDTMPVTGLLLHEYIPAAVTLKKACLNIRKIVDGIEEIPFILTIKTYGDVEAEEHIGITVKGSLHDEVIDRNIPANSELTITCMAPANCSGVWVAGLLAFKLSDQEERSRFMSEMEG